ncbi:dienelactone hydrolase family protein [Stakelama sp. CBK3Z-3]|uniref:Dienelactone hydrolase family protein n=1 Tax=Stakelama flava TaxID=2860338 RepID=A0ABS6XPQ4_9SPHN|nr:dienelactone hydrolase family protein [Stakelama flava]MBW4332197.1 dienelactone hydrolase family protein [Stakelama flava]
MTIQRRTHVYDGPGGPFEGVIAWDDEVPGERPGIAVIPNILGQKEADNCKAEDLAQLGYLGFAIDLYGQGRRTRLEDADRGKYMDELNADRALLRARLEASLAELKKQPEVNAGKTAAAGFCFGGKCAIDMVRYGADILGAVSFHGVYDRPDYDNVTPMRAKLLVCHGWEDPIGPPESVVALASELTEGGCDWQLDAYGHAGHAFTDVDRKDGDNPALRFEPKADRRSWAAMRYFLEELFA